MTSAMHSRCIPDVQINILKASWKHRRCEQASGVHREEFMLALKIFKMHSRYFVTRRHRRCLRDASPMSSRCIGDVFVKFDWQWHVIVTYNHLWYIVYRWYIDDNNMSIKLCKYIANASGEGRRCILKLRQDIGKASAIAKASAWKFLVPLPILHLECIGSASWVHRESFAKTSARRRESIADAFPMLSGSLFIKTHRECIRRISMLALNFCWPLGDTI